MNQKKSFSEFEFQQVIFQENDSADCAYLIESGEVLIYKNEPNGSISEIRKLGPGDIFGEFALLSSGYRSTSAKALTLVKCLVIYSEQILDKLSQSHELIQFFLRSVLVKLKGQLSFDANQNLGQKLIENLRKENQIIQAFETNEFVLYHQPLVDLKSNLIIGSEALVRWNSSESKIVPPSYFIQYIEDSFLAIPFGNWVIENCFKDYQKLSDQYSQFSISINISGKQFLHPQFLSSLDGLIQKYNVNPSCFKIEILERFLIEGEDFLEVMKQLKRRGFQIAVDDFGTGYSSLQILSKLPIDYIKIDRSFVLDVFKNEKTFYVLKAIFQLAQDLKMKTITEGLETIQDVNYFKQLGSHIGQGYFFSKPVHVLEFPKTV